MVKYEKILVKYDPTIEERMEVMKQLLPFFKCINDMYLDLSEQKDISFHNVYPSIKSILKTLKRLSEGNGMNANECLPDEESENDFDEIENEMSESDDEIPEEEYVDENKMNVFGKR